MSWLDEYAATPGLIAPPLVRHVPPPVCAEPAGTRDALCVRLVGRTNPVDAQHGPSCGGHALANALEVMLRRDADEQWLHARVTSLVGSTAWQLDGRRLWSELRRALYGDESGGLRLSDIAAAAELLDLGALVPVRVTPSSLVYTLHSAPVVLGLALSDGWRSPDRESGYVRPLTPHPWAGHAVCAVGYAEQDGHTYVVAANSWGQEWGYYGTCLVHLDYVRYCWLDDGVAYQPTAPHWWEAGRLLQYVVAHREEPA